MAIQFRCAGCSQPIEVDDEFAGQAATCPYCRRVITVPTESTLEAQGPIAARPSSSPQGDPPQSTPAESPAAAELPPPPGALHVGPHLTHREQVARSWGNYAALCVVLAMGMLGISLGYGVMLGMQMGLATPGSQPSQEQLEELQRATSENPWLAALQLGGLFFAIVGLCLGIVSLTQSRRGNWRGVLSVVVCGLLMLCVCSATILALGGGLGG